MSDYIQQVDDNADRAWRRMAGRAVRYISRTWPTFTTDQVWAVLDEHTNLKTHNPRALGAVMLAAKKEGLIESLDEWRTSARPACHGRPVRVWRRVE